ncbi:DUF4252 domain-containing protein [Xanthovirga aplysinae]|uniref:DUF4252 domain-containing protein n=1 Tax=Xanthovirga aplysinae TaxID=2529853 RepID=UPI0012BC996C|nr:DUF4252 domain-containing protein [Xanthovirga aplysinae]MTI32704.1 DUF4252 domain-containing protein [Xanthovirga aplysinae]
MKKFILILAIGLIPNLTFSQNKSIDDIFDQYAEKEGFTYVFISKHMFSLVSTFTKGENKGFDEETKKTMKTVNAISDQLDELKILASDHRVDETNGKEFYQELTSMISKDEYLEIMTVKDAKENIKFLIKQEGELISELLMVVGGTDQVLVDIKGNIDLKRIALLSQELNVEGLKYLKKIEK